MKAFINVEYLLKKYFLIAIASLALACDDEPEVDYSKNETLTQKVLDPFLQIQTPVIGFQAGTASYDLGFNVINGVKDINKVNVYSTFTGASGATSNEVLLGTYNV